MYNLEVKTTADRVFKKLAKKDNKHMTQISKKIEQILEDPYRFKPLKTPMEGLWRVHVGSFVIVYEIDENNHTVIIYYYDHHDNVYK